MLTLTILYIVLIYLLFITTTTNILDKWSSCGGSDPNLPPARAPELQPEQWGPSAPRHGLPWLGWECLLAGEKLLFHRSLFYLFLSLKGQCHEIFCFRFFYELSSPKPPENSIGVTSNFFRGSRCTDGIKNTVANLPLVSMTPVANSGYNIRLLTPEREL